MTSHSSDEPSGYGNPPKKSQYKPGQSGNPRGRPKENKVKSLQSVIQKGMQEPITLTIGSKRRTMSRAELIMTQLMNQAASGNLKAIETLIKFEKNAPPPDPTTGLLGAAERLRQKMQLTLDREKKRAKDQQGSSRQSHSCNSDAVVGKSADGDTLKDSAAASDALRVEPVSDDEPKSIKDDDAGTA